MTNTFGDYDSAWKEIIGTFFESFMLFFFPEAHQQIDWTKGYESLDNELQQVTIEAELGERITDKLMKVWLLNGEETWVLVHLEIQSQYQQDFPRRMYVYNSRLFNKYNRHVASIAILGDEKPNWRPQSYEAVLFGCRASLEFPIVKLLDYESRLEELGQTPNPFALVVTAHLKAKATTQNSTRRREEKIQLARALFAQGYSREEVIGLFRFILWVLRLPQELEESFRTELRAYQEENSMVYLTSYDQLVKEEGKEEGKQELIQRQLTRRFGQLEPETVSKIQTLSLAELDQLADALLDFQNMAELKTWLTQH